jgi:peptidyl-prolyl cis-trans isomerase C
LVEHRTENAGVAGSIPALAISPTRRRREGGPPNPRRFPVFRAIPLTLILILALAACSKGPAKDAGTTAQPTAAAQPGAPAEPIKPIPEKLPEVIARVNGESVTRKEIEDYVHNLEGRAGGPVPAEQRDRIYRGIIDQIVGYKLLVQEAKARKIDVPDAEVNAKIDEVKKQFPSEDLFMQTLIDRKLTIDQMKADARRDIAIARMIDAEIASRIALKPTQVEDFYKNNQGQFTQPERVRASHILISFPEGADAAAKAQAKTKAQRVLKDVKAGKDFAALAREHSQDPGSAPNGGDLGFFEQGRMVGPFNDVAFSLKPGATSDLVETQFGYHIIRVAEKQPGRTVPLEEVRPKVKQYLENLNKETETDAFVKSLRAKGKVQILI